MSSSDFGRTLVHALELDIDYCQNTYGVAPCTASGAAGSECYNTYKTCQAKADYSLGTKTIKFISRGAPQPAGELLRPYLKTVREAPTEMTPETGIAKRAQVTLTLADEPGSDVQWDKYAANRATAAQGTFWARLMARVHNYSGRPARLKVGYLTGNTFDWGAFSTRLYIIESIKGPSNGEVQITLGDIVRLADKAKVPVPSPAKLAVALNVNDLSLTLNSGEGGYFPASGYVRNGKEIIRYTSKAGDVLSWPNGTYRAQFGTPAQNSEANAAIQNCKVYTDTRLYLVLIDLLNEAGIDSANIDTAGFQSEDETWLNTNFLVNACISEPEEVTKLIGELCVQSMTALWFSPEDQKVKLRFLGPIVGAAVQSLTDDNALVEGSISVTPLDNLRITEAGVRYEIETATSDRKLATSYLRGEIYVDPSAESANEYGDVRPAIEYSRWFTGINATGIKATAHRRLAYYRDAPRQIAFDVDPKNSAIKAGDLVDITTADIVDASGAKNTLRVRITKRLDEGHRVKYTARSTTFTNRYAFIGPVGAPDYLSANEAQRAYAYICSSSGKMSNGEDGYRII